MSKVAVIQLNSSSRVDENLKQSETLIAKASENGAQLVVLPEMFAIMGKTEKDKVDASEKYSDGPIQSWLAAVSKKYNIWIVSGTIPIKTNNPNKIRAACIIFDSNGNVAGRYDKIHLFDASLSNGEVYRESDTTEAGDKIVVIDTPFGKLGVAVCYDLRFPNLFEQLHHRGAEIIAVPAAFTAKTGESHWHLLTRARSIDTFSYILASNQVGTHANQRQTFGHSLIVDPWGHILTESTVNTPDILYADIDLSRIHHIRNSIPTQLHKKVFQLS